jgi:dihydrofolate reductase
MMPDAVVYLATSLDGYIAGPSGELDWLPDAPEGSDLGFAEFIASVDALAMGRNTFETVLTFGGWPYEGTPVLVLSRTLIDVPERLAGKAEVSALAPAALLEELGTRGCKRVYIDGGRVIQSFLADDLVQEMILTLIPVVLGRGIPLFAPMDRKLDWDLVSSTVVGQGLVQLRYCRKR